MKFWGAAEKLINGRQKIMAKNIAIFSDGTGNSTIKDRGTNVFKMYEMVELHDKNQPQVSIYDDGVGTEKLKFLKALGGAFGLGLSHNVRRLYAELARVYEPGDRIYLFGFSRGAFTVRTLAGLISNCGIIDHSRCRDDSELYLRVRKAFQVHHNAKRALLEWMLYKAVRPLAWIFPDRYGHLTPQQFRKKYSVVNDKSAPDGIVDIDFIGVWDTVSAVGFPILWIADALNLLVYRFKFSDDRLCTTVKKACHALSIDDERHTFHPLLWQEDDQSKARLEQVWFPGVHANVGGGYPRQGLSLVALDWMMTKAEGAGLKLISQDRTLYQERSNPHGKLYDPRAGLGIYYRYQPRDIAQKCFTHRITPKIHVSALERILNRTEGYAPGNLPRGMKLITTRGDLPKGLEKADQIIDQALGNNSSLLQRTQGWITVRRFAHWGFFIVTLAALTSLFTVESLRSGMIGAIKIFFTSGISVFDNFLTINPSDVVVAVAAYLGFFYFLGVTARRRMQSIFSKFWYQVIPKLKPEETHNHDHKHQTKTEQRKETAPVE